MFYLAFFSNAFQSMFVHSDMICEGSSCHSQNHACQTCHHTYHRISHPGKQPSFFQQLNGFQRKRGKRRETSAETGFQKQHQPRRFRPSVCRQSYDQSDQKCSCQIGDKRHHREIRFHRNQADQVPAHRACRTSCRHQYHFLYQSTDTPFHSKNPRKTSDCCALPASPANVFRGLLFTESPGRSPLSFSTHNMPVPPPADHPSCSPERKY